MRVSRRTQSPAIPTSYEIWVEGLVPGEWSEWFDDMEISHTGDNRERPITLLIGRVKDQAALRGLLGKIWNLNLTLIALFRLEVDDDFPNTQGADEILLEVKDGDRNTGCEYT